MEDQKVWLVTGASKGLGLSLVKQLLLKGYKVAATTRNVSELENQVNENKENLLSLAVDLTKEKSVNDAITETIKRFGKLDVVVNNAGYALLGSIEEVTDQEFRQTMDVNVFGTINVIRAAMPYLRKQQSGHIFNISSIGGYRGSANGGSYSTAKFALIGLSEALAEEVKPFGIHVTVVAPGFFRTSFLTEGSVMVTKNKIDAYAGRTQLEAAMKEMNGKQQGDPDKLATALIEVAASENPPVHLLMGPDAYQVALDKQQADRQEFEQWKELTCSTNIES